MVLAEPMRSIRACSLPELRTKGASVVDYCFWTVLTVQIGPLPEPYLQLRPSDSSMCCSCSWLGPHILPTKMGCKWHRKRVAHICPMRACAHTCEGCKAFACCNAQLVSTSAYNLCMRHSSQFLLITVVGPCHAFRGLLHQNGDCFMHVVAP